MIPPEVSPPKASVHLWYRLLTILLGAVLLFWLPFEDTRESGLVLLAALISTWFLVTLWIQKPSRIRQKPWKITLAGAAAGAVVTPLALLLMAIKTGLHGHPQPDFTVGQMVSILNRAPVWIVAGLLFGMGAGLWQHSSRIKMEH